MMKCEPQETWEHHAVYTRVKKLLSDPDLLRRLKIPSMVAMLPPSIAVEPMVITALNNARKNWDPNGDYANYEFVRRDKLPDIVLQHKRKKESDILFGIELKSWNIFAKEGEPSFRFKASADALSVADLFACFPWVYENFIGGKLLFFKPFVVPARWAASRRNHHWQSERDAESDASIPCREGIVPYPETETLMQTRSGVSEHPVYDGGKNFGRLARSGCMDEWIRQTFEELHHDLPCEVWYDFFRLCQRERTKAGTKTRQQMLKNVTALRKKIQEKKVSVMHSKLAQGIERCLCAIENGRNGEAALRAEEKKWSRIRFT